MLNDRDAVVKESGLKEKQKNKAMQALHATFAHITRPDIRNEALRGCPLVPITSLNG